MIKYSDFRHESTGAVSVELIAAVPVLVIIIIGMADVSNFFLTQARLDRNIRDAIQTHYVAGPRDPALIVTPGCSCSALELTSASGCTDKSSTTHTTLHLEEAVIFHAMPSRVVKSAVCVLNL